LPKSSPADVPTCRRADVPTCRRADVPADVPTRRRLTRRTLRPLFGSACGPLPAAPRWAPSGWGDGRLFYDWLVGSDSTRVTRKLRATCNVQRATRVIRCNAGATSDVTAAPPLCKGQLRHKVEEALGVKKRDAVRPAPTPSDPHSTPCGWPWEYWRGVGMARPSSFLVSFHRKDTFRSRMRCDNQARVPWGSTKPPKVKECHVGRRSLTETHVQGLHVRNTMKVFSRVMKC